MARPSSKNRPSGRRTWADLVREVLSQRPGQPLEVFDIYHHVGILAPDRVHEEQHVVAKVDRALRRLIREGHVDEVVATTYTWMEDDEK